MRSLVAVLSLLVSLACGSSALAQPQRLYLPAQSITVSKSGTLVCRCADGSRRPAPKSDETYTGLHGEVVVSRRKAGEKPSNPVRLTDAIEKGWVKVHGNNGADTSVSITNLDENYTVTVEVRKNSLLLPSPTDLTAAERTRFDENAKHAPEAMKSASGAHPDLRNHVGEYSPLAALRPSSGSLPFLLDPDKNVETDSGRAVNDGATVLFRVMYDQTRRWAAEDRYTFLWLILGKKPTQEAVDALAKAEVIGDKTLPNAKLDNQSCAHIAAIVELHGRIARTTTGVPEKALDDTLLPVQALRSLAARERVTAADRPAMLSKIRAALAKTLHSRDVKACEGVVGPNDVIAHLDGPDLLVSVEKGGRRLSVPVPMTVPREVAIEQYNSDINGRRFQKLLLEKPDQLRERLINRYPTGPKQGKSLDDAAAGYGYLPLLQAIVTSVEGVERPVVYLRGSSAGGIDFANLYAMVQAAGVEGCGRDITFVTVADYGRRADPMRQAVENYNRQEGFTNIRSVLALALPDPNNPVGLEKSLVWRWLSGLKLLDKNGAELPDQGRGPPNKVNTLPLLNQLVGPYIDLAKSLGLGTAFIHDPATAGEYWKRVGQAFEGHTGDGALVNLFTGHSSAMGGDYLYFRDERVAWQDFIQGRPTGVLPRDYIQADFRCYAGSERVVEDVLAGPGAATMAISPTGQIDIEESKYLIDAYLRELNVKDATPAKAYARALTEYHKKLRHEGRAKQFQHRYQFELPRLHSQRPVDAQMCQS